MKLTAYRKYPQQLKSWGLLKFETPYEAGLKYDAFMKKNVNLKGNIREDSTIETFDIIIEIKNTPYKS